MLVTEILFSFPYFIMFDNVIKCEKLVKIKQVKKRKAEKQEG